MRGPDKTSALQGVLQEMRQLLESMSEKHWSNRIGGVLEGRLSVNEVSTWFGGMGSLNDFTVSALNGHNARPERVDALNAKLESLRRELFEAARSLDPAAR